MSVQSFRITQPLFSLLTTALLATACSDSTAPSTGEGSGSDTQAPSPGATSTRPDHEPSAAPAATQPAPGDSGASSLKPSLYTKSTSYGSGWAPGPGGTIVSRGAVGCLGGFLSVSNGVAVSRTTGLSFQYHQYVVGEAFFYRWNGTSWVNKGMRRADADLPPAVTAASIRQPDLFLANPGSYTVMLRLTWYIWTNGGWVRTAGVNVNFVHPADYSAVVGATAGPGGYCTVS